MTAIERNKILQQIRNAFLGKDVKEPDTELLSELYQTDPEFRKAYDSDEVIHETMKQWVQGNKECTQEAFRKFRAFCLGKTSEVPHRQAIKIQYQTNSEFRKACDTDEVVRKVLKQWFEEENKSSSQ